MNLFDRLKSAFGFGNQEGSWRGPFQGIGELGGWYNIENIGDGWQRNLSIGRTYGNATKHAAINLYVHGFQAMPVWHRKKVGAGWEVIKSSALSRFLRKPNDEQTWPEFVGSGVRGLQQTGNAVARVWRNDRTEIVSARWASGHNIYRDPDSGALFYSCQFDDSSLRADELIPARDIIHLRINADPHQLLRGRTNIEHCAQSMLVNGTVSDFLAAFLNNRGSPAYGLSTDMQLTAGQMTQLRQAFNEQAKQTASGGTVILSHGMKPVPMGSVPPDSMTETVFNLSATDIATAFSLPKGLINQDETASNSRSSIEMWISLGLGALVQVVESSFAKAFELPAEEEIYFDSDALLRLNPEKMADYAQALTTGGVLSSDEARSLLGWGAVSGGYGKIPRVQQQMVGLDLVDQMHSADLKARLREPAPAPAPAPEPAAPAADDSSAKILAEVGALHKLLAEKATETPWEEIKAEIVALKPVPAVLEVKPDPVEADPELTKALVVDLFERRRKRTA
jgi:HK97 family phage portal protein